MTSVYAFVISMHMAVFGGHVEAQFRTPTEAGCVKFRNVIVRELRENRLRFEVKGCGDPISVPLTEPFAPFIER